MADANRQDHAYNLRKVLERMELDLVDNMRRNIKRHEVEEEKEGFRWEMWQEAKLRNLWKYRKENKDIVKQYIPEVESAVHKALEEEFEHGRSLLDRLLGRIKYPKDISGNPLNHEAKRELDFFGVNKKRLEVLHEEAEKVLSKETPNTELFHPEGLEKKLEGTTNQKKTSDMADKVSKDIKDAQRAAWRRMDDIYRRTIYQAGMSMAAGAKTLDQAIDMATKSFLENGIDCIEYKNGRRVNIASYAEMALRTASQRAMLLGDGQKRDEWGIHTVVVSAHANTCPLCAPWQGKVLIDDVFSSGTKEEAERLGYPLLSTAMKAGLLH